MSGSVSLVNGHIDSNKNEMTDKEIIQALNTATNIDGLQICCIDYENNPENATYLSIKSDIVALINRQQAEHDELKNNYRKTLTKQVELCDVIEKQQAEIEEHKKNCGKCGAKTRECIEGLQNNIAEKRAEIERLTINMNAFGLGMKREKEKADTIRAEAIKEFAGKIADVFCSHDKGDAYVREVVYNLVKEMVGK